VLATIEELLAIAIERVSTTKFEIQPNGAEVRVDGRFVGRAPLRKALYLDPGHHKVEARLPGYVHQAREIACRAGTTQEVRITLAQERRAKDTEGGGDPRLPVAITAMALGAVAVAAGVGLVVAAQSRSDGVAILQEEITSDPAAPTENPCSSGPSRHPKCDELQDAADQELAFQWGGVAALIGGGALLLGGTLYLVIPLSIADTRETATIVTEPNSVLVRGRF